MIRKHSPKVSTKREKESRLMRDLRLLKAIEEFNFELMIYNLTLLS